MLKTGILNPHLNSLRAIGLIWAADTTPYASLNLESA